MIYLFTIDADDTKHDAFDGYYYYDNGSILCVLLNNYYLYDVNEKKFQMYNPFDINVPRNQTVINIYSYSDLNKLIEKEVMSIILNNII